MEWRLSSTFPLTPLTRLLGTQKLFQETSDWETQCWILDLVRFLQVLLWLKKKQELGLEPVVLPELALLMESLKPEMLGFEEPQLREA